MYYLKLNDCDSSYFKGEMEDMICIPQRIHVISQRIEHTFFSESFGKKPVVE